MIPQDDFTPYGYIDNPYHSWKISPCGVLRSLEPLGMGWHVPNLGTYVRNQFQYTSHLTIGLKIGESGGLVLVTLEDFRRHGCTITSQLHTKNRFEYTCTVPQYGLTVNASYFLVQKDALGCVLSLSSTLEHPLPVTCYLIHCHTHNPYTSRLWEHGLYARKGVDEGCAMLGIASEGDVFIHGARAADGDELIFGDIGYVVTLDEVSAWAKGAKVREPHITQSQEDSGWQVRAVALPCTLTLEKDEQRILNSILARGVSQDAAAEHWVDGIEEIARAEAEHRADDEEFWQKAPQLSGNWPDYWRRGLVYDLETLRMTIRPSAGIIPAEFDGMQIQAPRTVLAEAAMDILFLSYANPDLAAEIILGHFESSPRANLPCMREDGSYNMVADDGQICGTAPEWGFPLWCCDQLFRRTGDMHWLRRLYPKVAAYMRWWLDHRTDTEGWLVYACSWESGQDVSSRFGPQQTGGTIIQHVRPVDLQASMAQGAEIIARWAMLLLYDTPTQNASNAIPLGDVALSTVPPVDFAGEVASWQKVASEFTAKTRNMWRDGWFRDYDSVAREWSSQQDGMHLAPVFCGASDWEQIEQLRPYLSQPPSHSNGWAPLCWPPVVMTLIGAASVAKMPFDAAELAYQFIDASYRSIDSHTPDEESGLPGITREYRRVVNINRKGVIEYANAGIEGYGWGALSVHLLMRYIMGLREEEAGKLIVAPVLPHALRQVGSTYRVGPVQWGEYALQLECTVSGDNNYTLLLRSSTIVDEERLISSVDEKQWQLEGTWGQEHLIKLS
jgi:hypothetical protein